LCVRAGHSHGSRACCLPVTHVSPPPSKGPCRARGAPLHATAAHGLRFARQARQRAVAARGGALPGAAPLRTEVAAALARGVRACCIALPPTACPHAAHRFSTACGRFWWAMDRANATFQGKGRLRSGHRNVLRVQATQSRRCRIDGPANTAARA